MTAGRVVILSGPSGVGKDTVIDAWHKVNPCVKRVVAYTTRPPRPGERPDVDYHFVAVERFHRMAAAGDFLEHKEVHGNYYATPLRDLESMVADGLIAILKIDVQGAITAMEALPDALSIFLLPPSWDELARRIRERGTEDPEQVAVRLRNAETEMAISERYRCRIVNRNVADTVRELETCIKIEA